MEINPLELEKEWLLKQWQRKLEVTLDAFNDKLPENLFKLFAEELKTISNL